MFQYLGMSITLEIDRKFCVYLHSCGNDLIYVGSGPYSRAFVVGLKERGKRWFEAVKGRPVTVSILSTHVDRQEAMQAEFDHIYGLQPIANVAGTLRSLTAKPTLPRGRPSRASLALRDQKNAPLKPCVFCVTTGRRFWSLREASAVYGIPLTTLSRGIRDEKPVKYAGQVYLFRIKEP